MTSLSCIHFFVANPLRLDNLIALSIHGEAVEVLQVGGVDVAIAASDKEAAAAALKNAISEISRAASKGVFHRNTASRKIGRLTKAVNKIA